MIYNPRKDAIEAIEDIDNEEVRVKLRQGWVDSGRQSWPIERTEYVVTALLGLRIPGNDYYGVESDTYFLKIAALISLFGNVGDGNVDLLRSPSNIMYCQPLTPTHDESYITPALKGVLSVIENPHLESAVFTVGDKNVIIRRDVKSGAESEIKR